MSDRKRGGNVDDATYRRLTQRDRIAAFRSGPRRGRTNYAVMMSNPHRKSI